MTKPLKKHNTIGCCGIDCGLCPRFFTKGDSACPGCGGLKFKEKHPSCGFLTCCVIKNGLEVCSDCKDYPCDRFDSEREGYDSFVTHRKVFPNLEHIKNSGIESFIEQQNKRREILIAFLSKYDDGRSKNFFCLSCALLPLKELKEILQFAYQLDKTKDIKEKNKLLKAQLIDISENLEIELKLNKKK